MGHQARISLVGPTGSGKTTSAWMIHRMIPGSAVISLAQPMRDLEDHVCKILGRPPPQLTGSQDGRLLQQLREVLLTRDPDILGSTFVQSVDICASSLLIVNDDCRLGSKYWLDRLSFLYVWVQGSHSGQRKDQTPAARTSLAHDAIIDRDLCDHVLGNEGTFGDLWQQASLLLTSLGVLQ